MYLSYYLLGLFLTDYLVGTGGWAYFKVPGESSLEVYSRVFNFVEVNYTFYEYPDVKRVEHWRRVVPTNFTFSVRCHQDLTHRIGLRPTDEAYGVLARMTEYCSVLDSPFLVLETPRRYVLDSKAMSDARDFLSSANLKGIQLVWDVRASLTAEVTELMENLGIVQSVDLSRQEPVVSSDMVYSRLFGKGWHNRYQFTDNELLDIDSKVEKAKPKVAALSYHGMRMNIDAARFRTFKKTGQFIPITSFTGLESAKAVLAEDTKFPSSKEELIREQGWKVIDLTAAKRVHLSDMLLKIPGKTYNNLDDVVTALEAVV